MLTTKVKLSKGESLLMDVTNKEILRLKLNSIEIIETETLFQIIRNDPTTNASIQCLAELLHRQESQM